MPPTTSSNPDVTRLLALSNTRLQGLVMKAFRQTGKRAMARSTIVEEIARAEGVTQLRGSKRDQLQKNVNAAIGVLLRTSKLVRRGTTNEAVALPSAPKSSAPQTRMLNAVRDRIVLLRFTCVACGHVNEIRDLTAEGWCERDGCLTSFYEGA